MSIEVFTIDGERFLRRIPDPVTASRIPMCDSPIWVDMGKGESEPMEELLRALGVHPLAIEACLEELPSSRFGAYGTSLYVGLPILAKLDDDARELVSILCLPGILVTIHDAAVPALENIKAEFVSTMKFHTSSTASILYQILDHIIDQDLLLTLEAHERIDYFEDALDEDGVSGPPNEMLVLKRQLIRLETILEDQHHGVSTLQTIESDAFSIDGLQDYFRDALRHLEHAVRSVNRQSGRLIDMQQHYLFKLQDIANKRLQILTVVSSIFMPLMLVTGIYGMNFRHMPELSWRFSYPVVLTFMAIVAVLLNWLFRRKGWFK